MSVFDFEPEIKDDEDQEIDESGVDTENEEIEADDDQATGEIKKAGIIIGIITFVAIAIVVVMIILANINKADQADNDVSMAVVTTESTSVTDASGSEEEITKETYTKESTKEAEKTTEAKQETDKIETENETEETGIFITTEAQEQTDSDGRVHRVVSGFLDSNEYPEIVELIKTYYKTINKGKYSSLNSLMLAAGGEEATVNESELAENMELVEKYKNADFFILKGLEANTYIVYVTYDVKFYNVDTLAPSLSRFFLKPDENGELKIYQGKATASEYSYITASESFNQVRELVSLIDTELKKAKQSDGKLHALLNMIG